MRKEKKIATSSRENKENTTAAKLQKISHASHHIALSAPSSRSVEITGTFHKAIITANSLA
jgi:hypothetical protein